MSRQNQFSKLFNSVALITLLTPAVTMIASNPAAAETAAEEESDSNVIVVTARGREETLIEVPISVSVLSQDQLDSAGVSDIQSMSAYTPGFRFENSDGQAGGKTSSTLQFRGISAQVNSAASRTGAVFYDGSYISQGVGFIPMIDLERVEVIKGPQNAFFARNTFSGAVNFVPKLPGDELEVSGELELGLGTGRGEQASYRGVVAVGGPVTDSIGLRVAATYERKGADYQYEDGSPNGEEDNFAIFGTATFAVTDTFNVKATGYFVDAKDTSNAQGVNATVAPGDCNLTFSGEGFNGVTGAFTPFTTDLSQSLQTTFCGTIPDASNATRSGATPFFGILASPSADLAGITDKFPDGLGNEYGAWRANLSFDWEIGDYTLKGLASQGEAKLGGIQDVFFGEDGNPNAPSTFQFQAPLQNFTQDTFFEARLASSQDKRLRYEIGVSYYEQEFRNANTFTTDFQDNEAFGIFGTIDFDITDALTISAEGRWVDDEQTVVYNGAPGFADTEATVNSSNSYQDFMPRVILSYSPDANLNIYASWSESSLNAVATNADRYSSVTTAAGLNLLPDPTLVGDFTDIQTLQSFEIGIKQRVSDWLSYSIAAYYMDWTNQPFSNSFLVAAGTSFGSTTLNLDGDSEYKGIDFEITLTPTDGLQLFGNVGWVDAELNRLASAGSVATQVLCPGSAALTTGPICTGLLTSTGISGAGNRPANVSEWSGSVGASYAHPIPTGELYIRGDALYRGSRFIDNFEYNKIGSSWRVNMRAGADVTENFRIEAFVENLFQDDTFQSAGNTGLAFGGGNTGRKAFGTLPEKREIGFRASFDF